MIVPNCTICGCGPGPGLGVMHLAVSMYASMVYGLQWGCAASKGLLCKLPKTRVCFQQKGPKQWYTLYYTIETNVITYSHHAHDALGLVFFYFT